MSRLLRLGFAVCLTVAVSTQASFADGVPSTSGEFLQMCKQLATAMDTNTLEVRHSNSDDGFCMGFVIGAGQAINDYQATIGKKDICFPKEAVIGDYVRVWIDYLESHPRSADTEPFQTFYHAMGAKYPCAKPGAGPGG